MQLRHICEVCGADEVLESEDAFTAGWDYPPRMGTFGILSPRTCPNCPVNKTVWWAVAMEKKATLTSQQMETVERITAEPESIMAESQPH